MCFSRKLRAARSKNAPAIQRAPSRLLHQCRQEWESMSPRRVLMVCYYFPPVQSAGCTRSVAFATNLPAVGWEPTVLTVARSRDPWVRTGAAVPEGVRIVRTREWRLAPLLDLAHGALSRVIGDGTNWFR